MTRISENGQQIIKGDKIQLGICRLLHYYLIAHEMIKLAIISNGNQ